LRCIAGGSLPHRSKALRRRSPWRLFSLGPALPHLFLRNRALLVVMRPDGAFVLVHVIKAVVVLRPELVEERLIVDDGRIVFDL